MADIRSFSGAALVLIVAAGLPATALAQGVHIEGAGQTDNRVDCNGGPVHVEGASNTLTITGACSGLTVEGAGNTITIDLAPGARVRVEGASNRVNWSMPGDARPALSVEGAGNQVQRR